MDLEKTQGTVFMKQLLDLYLTFFKMGSVTFGGGYAMLPILQREVVEKKQWVTNEEIMDYYALSQALPGIIAANIGTFVGFKMKKFPGAVAASLGVVSPCLVIIMTIAAFLSNFQDNIYVQHAFSGISICVIALIFSSVLKLWKKSVKDYVGLGLCILIFCGSVFTDLSPILYVVGAALVGILYNSFIAGKKEESR